MSFAPNGELTPVGGGDPVPLIRPVLTVGRRESCDVCIRQPNVSGLHCELTFRDGHWLIKDLGSTNGVKVNNVRVPKKVLHPGDVITIAKRNYTIDYTPLVGKHALEEMMEDEDIMSQGLLEKAGLVHRRTPARRPGAKGAPLPDELEDEDVVDEE